MMAQRYGGKYSPQGGADDAPLSGSAQTRNTTTPAANPFEGRRRSRVGGRVNLLFAAPLPLVSTAFTSGPVGLATDLVALGVLWFGAWLTREGVRAHEAYDARKVARRPSLPRKVIGAVMIGVGIATAAMGPDASLLGPVLLGLIGTALHVLSFGLDPMTAKGMDDVDTRQHGRAMRAVGEAEKMLTDMQAAILRTGDRRMQARVEKFGTTARTMFRTVEEDPRDLTAARKYLTVYMMGARDAAVKYAGLHARDRDTKTRAEFEALLDDLEQNFAARTRKMLADDRIDLDVEIDVLRDRLRRDGIEAQ